MAALVISTVPVVCVYLFMQKHIIKGLSSGVTIG